MRADHHELPTPRTTLRARYVRVLVWCKSCRHRRDADLQGLVDAGRGDMPLVALRFRCSNCRSRLTDFVVTSRDEPRPW
jgi:Zn finger protein HypA/HybF involved in hydrogenase expression